MERENIVVSKSIEFSLDIISYCDNLELSRKFVIAAKEIEEAKYWLILCEKAPSYPFDVQLKLKINELGPIIYKIISSSKTK